VRNPLVAMILAAFGCIGVASCRSAEFHVFEPEGRPIPVTFRAVGLDEGTLLFRSDESDDAEAAMRAFWDENPEAYYRWDAADGAEMGLVGDIARNLFMLQYVGAEDENLRPQVVVARVDGRDRIVAVGTLEGDVHFHSDSELRRRGFRGMGTCLVVAFLRSRLAQGVDAFVTSVNGSYGFYEKLGFRFSDPARTPETTADPASERFDMVVPAAQIRAVLAELTARDAAAVVHFELHGTGGDR
jgi:hypothetical protein